MDFVIGFIRIIRPINLFLIFFTCMVIKYRLVQDFNTLHLATNLSSTLFKVLMGMLVLLAAAGNIINDYFDVEADKVNKPNKIFIGNKISQKQALILYYVTTILAVSLGTYLAIGANKAYFILIPLVYSFALYFYSLKLKKVIFWGNLLISVLVALVPLIIAVYELPKANQFNTDVVNNSWQLLIAFTVFAFTSNFAREVQKDIADVEGDIRAGYTSIAIKYGLNRAKILVSITLLVEAFASYSFFMNLNQLSLPVLYLYAILLVFIIASLLTTGFAKKRKGFIIASNLNKLSMFIGLLMILYL